MSGRVIVAAALLATAFRPASFAPAQQATLPYRNSSLAADERVADLLARMSLEEKFWQLFMIPGSLDDPEHDYSHGVFGLQISTALDGGEGALGKGNATAGAIATGGDAGVIPVGISTTEAAETAQAARIARAHAERINAIQRFFVEETRLGIPIIPFDEAVHGLTRAGATVFPQAIALAANW